ncbi:MAG: hypothetical protein AAF958_20255 [Planctomycetota bacterium]
MKPKADRRQFVRTLAATAIAGPAIVTAKRSAAQDVIGSGDYKYQFDHGFAKLPDRFRWQTTHNVAVDPDNNLYVIHEGKADLKDHPSIFVFDPEGKFIRAFGQQFQGGGHGIDVRVEDGTPFLYVAAYQNVKAIAKLNLLGETVWMHHAPMASQVYNESEGTNPQKIWGRDRFMPTNFAFLPDGGFLLADGYGSFYIHRYDKDGNWVSCFGGAGKGEGTFNTPHGIWIDDRGDAPKIVVADRAHDDLQIFSIDGVYESTVTGFGLPANLDTYKEWMLVPELKARVTILDADNQTVVTLGDDRKRVLADQKANKGFKIRTDESQWQDGKFVHPHDARFDNNGDLFVAEWVRTGRVTKLTRV